MLNRIAPLALAVLLLPSVAPAIQLPTDFEEVTEAQNLDRPVSIRSLPGDRFLVAEQTSRRIRILRNGTALGDAIVVPNVNTLGGERGLIAIEVDIDWPTRPFVYAYYTAASPSEVRVTRFTASGDLDGTGDGIFTLSASSALHILTGVSDQASNHNGGDLRFGSDGLYISIGDDEHRRCEAQNNTSLLGKILRLKVDELSPTATGTAALADVDPGNNPIQNEGARAALMWTKGLRNPVRFQIDSADGSLFVADVGKNRWEEISHVEESNLNLGWPYREALADTSTDPAIDLRDCSTVPPGFTNLPPVSAYSHGAGSRSIVGGPVYRASGEGAFPAEYIGDVFYVDFYVGDLVRIKGSGQSYAPAPAVAGQPSPNYWATDLADGPVDFLVDDGDLIYLSYGQPFLTNSGSIRRIRYVGALTDTPSSFGAIKGAYDVPQPEDND